MSQIDYHNPYQNPNLNPYEAPHLPKKSSAAWTPAPDIVDHLDCAISPSWDFFAPPPENIGRLYTAASTLTKEEEPWSMASRAMLAGGIFLVCTVITFGIGIAFQWDPVAYLVVGPAIGGVGGLIAWFCTSFEHAVTYVGEEGCARIWCGGDRDSISAVEIFRFETAAELRTAETRHYKNGIYQHTSFSFDWTNQAGSSVYNISGSHGVEFGTPPAETDYAYANKAELAWSQYMFAKLIEPITRGGFTQFNLSGGDWVRVGNRFLEFNIGGTTERVRTEDLLSDEIANGWLKMKRKDAVEGWFANTGVFEFAYSDLANAQLFLMLYGRFAAPGSGQ